MAIRGKLRSMGPAPVVVWTKLPIDNESCLTPQVYIGDFPSFDLERSSVFAISGCGAIGGKFIKGVDDVNEVLKIQGGSGLEIARSIRGSLCLYAWDADKRTVCLLPDPFGAGLLFYYEGNHIAAVSSDLHALVSRLRDLGESLTLSIKYAVEMAFVGNAGLVHTPYDEISVLRNFSYIEVSTEKFAVQSYGWAKKVFDDTPVGFAGVEVIADEILANTKAAVEVTAHRKIAHLTAGFDSRLVLATILHNGAKDAFTWHTTGGAQSVDVMIAEELSSAEGLRMSHYPGYGTYSNPAGHEFRIRAPYDYSEGMIGVGPHQRNVHDGSVLLSGGYGELLRSFFDVRFDAAGMSTEDQFERISWVGRKVSPDRSAPLMTKDFSLFLHAEYCKHLDRGREFGINPDSLMDYYYLSNRNRYWVGLGARLWSDVCYKFDPLYSVTAATVGLKQSRHERIHNFLGLDLMLKVRPQLLQYRYGREVISEVYKAARPVPKLKFGAVKPTTSPWIDGPYRTGHEWTDPLCRDDVFPRVTPSDVEAAKRVRVSPRQWVTRHLVRDRVKELLQTVRTDDLGAVFNMDELSIMLKSSPSTMGKIRLLNSLHGSLLWMQSKSR